MAKLEMDLPQMVSEEEARLLLTIKLFDLRRVSLGKAAEMAGYSVRAFAELLGHYGVPIYRYDPDDLDTEMQR